MTSRVAGWVENEKRIFAFQGDKKRSTAQETIIHKPTDQTDALGTGHIPKVLLDSSSCSRGSGVSGSDSKTQIYDGYNKAFLKGKEAKALRTNESCHTAGNLVVSGLMSGTNTPAKYIVRTSGAKNCKKATSEKSKQTTFQTVTYSLVDFLAKVSRLQGNGKVQENLAERYLRRLLGLRQLKDPAYYSWKTSKASYLQTMAETLPESFDHWGTWIIYWKGKCLTASGFCLRTERESSLSDILQENVPERYFLSEKLITSLLKHTEKMKAKGNGFSVQIHSVPDTTKMEVKT